MGSLTRDPIRLHCARSGAGDLLFLIHAFPLDHTMWASQISSLRKRWRVLAPDLPGFGESPPSPGWRLSDVAAALLEIAGREHAGPFGIVGLSMGTYAALEILRQAPDRVRWLVLADGRARADNEAERQSRTALIERIEREGVGILEEVMLGRLLKPDPVPDLARRVARDMSTATPGAVVAGIEALRERADSSGLLGSIRCPTLVIAGESDPLTTPDECRAMTAAIPGARFAGIPDAGHLSNLENPVAFDRALDEFLTSL